MNKMAGNALRWKLQITITLTIGFFSGICAGSGRMGEIPKLSAGPGYTFNSLFFTLDYLSKTNTLGVVTDSIRQPGYSASMLFYSKYNFDIGLSATVNSNSDSSFSEASTEFNFMAGYTFSIAEDLTIYPSYTHLEYSKNNYALQSVFSDILQLDIYLDKSWYYGGISTSYFFGKKNMFFASVQNAFGYVKEDFLLKNSYFSLHLEFDVNISDRNYYNQSLYFEWESDEFLSWIQEYYPRSHDIIEERVIRNGLEETKTFFFGIVNEYDPEVFQSSYTVTSVDLMLPVYYSIGSFMFNFTPYILIPTYNSIFYEQDPLFIFSAGIAYSLKL